LNPTRGSPLCASGVATVVPSLVPLLSQFPYMPGPVAMRLLLGAFHPSEESIRWAPGPSRKFLSQFQPPAPWKSIFSSPCFRRPILLPDAPWCSHEVIPTMNFLPGFSAFLPPFHSFFAVLSFPPSTPRAHRPTYQKGRPASIFLTC